jgi:phosphohistidine swiveling domain-containing protein
MLIHGSIIAREYGIPCVTGIPQATSLIHTGDSVTVDGYLGIVIVGWGQPGLYGETFAFSICLGFQKKKGW